ncbi:MAG: 2-oxo acid dehydrogenase subunit E2 [Acidimicrobiia bacterium]|nr:2-oxo acid dehydrogenase subunit E2 [Acidimicrobiia bacterium]NNL28485.1 hypothetical protein [Acidimicrobiia bacterium]
MAVTVTMPQLGETVTEGVVLRWAKQVGDTVSEDEVLLEISTDKVDTEIPSPSSGVLQEILVQEGETVAVGAQLAIIGEADGAGAASDSEPESRVQSAAPEMAEQDSSTEPPAPEAPAAAPTPQPVAAAEAAPAATGGGGFTVEMPQLGETVTEGVVLSWAKSVGDAVAEDEVLLEISTDKVDTEIPSPAAGVLQEILVPVGETAQVGTALAIIGSAAGAPAQVVADPVSSGADNVPMTDGATQASPAADANGQSGSLEGSGRGNVSPVVRKLAREANVDLDRVPGTGKNGRITRKDVEAFIASGGQSPAPAAAAPAQPPASPTTPEPTPSSAAPPPPPPPVPAPAATTAPAAASTAPAGEPAPAGQPAPAGDGVEPPEGVPLLAGDRVVALDRLRQRIAKNMILAKTTAAHVWTAVEVDYELVEQIRQKHKADFKAREGFSLTYLPFVARAVVDALAAFPVVNSSIYPDQGKAVYHEARNIGIAIDLNQEGLLVGTVRNADSLRIVGLARNIRAVADRARSGSLEPDDVSGSTFSISNPGPYGSFLTAPIINVPNTAILSTDTVTKRAVVATDTAGNDSIAIRHIGYLGLTWDHRAFDGSTAVLFLQRIKHNLETWDWEQELA